MKNEVSNGFALVFFVLFRETLETAIIVSVLLAFLKQTLGSVDNGVVYKKLRKQVSNAPLYWRCPSTQYGPPC